MGENAPNSGAESQYDSAREIAGEYDDLRIPEDIITHEELQREIKRIEEDLEIDDFTEAVNRRILHMFVMANSLEKQIKELNDVDEADDKLIESLTRKLIDVKERIGFELYSLYETDMFLDEIERYEKYKEEHPDVVIEDQEKRETAMNVQLKRIEETLRKTVQRDEVKMLLHKWREESDPAKKAKIKRELDEEYARLDISPRLDVEDPKLADALEGLWSKLAFELQQDLAYQDRDCREVSMLLYRWKNSSSEDRSAIETEMHEKIEECSVSPNENAREAGSALEQFLDGERSDLDVDNLNESIPKNPFPGVLLHADQLIAQIDNLQVLDPRSSIENRRELIKPVRDVTAELMKKKVEMFVISSGGEHIARRYAKDSPEGVALFSKEAKGMAEAQRARAFDQISQMLADINNLEESTLNIGPNEHVEEFWVKEVRPRIVELMQKLRWLYGKVDDPEREKSSKDAIMEFDRRSMESAKESLEIASALLSTPEYKLENLTLAEPAENPPEGTRITLEVIEKYRQGSPGERARVWELFKKQIADDMDSFSDEKAELVEEFAEIAEVSDEMEWEFIKAGENAQKVLARLYAIIGALIAAFLLAGPISSYLTYRAMRRQMRKYARPKGGAPKSPVKPAPKPVPKSSTPKPESRLPTKKAPPASAAKRTPMSSRPTAAPKAPSGTPPKTPSRLPKLPKGIGTFLGYAGTIYLGWETVEAIKLARSIEDLPERQGVDSSLELMETHPNIDRDADRYVGEVLSLRLRQKLILMREITKHELASLKELGVPLGSLQEEADKIIDDAKRINRELYDFFPITDYVKRSSRDPKGAVRVIFSRLTSARRDGAKNAEKKSERKWLYRNIPSALGGEKAKNVFEEAEEKAQMREKAKPLTKEIYEGLPMNMWHSGKIGQYRDDFESTLMRYTEFLQSASAFHLNLEK
jgi:hypothetical protein